MNIPVALESRRAFMDSGLRDVTGETIIGRVIDLADSLESM